MNTQTLDSIIATFFINKFLGTIVPKSNNVKDYRESIDRYLVLNKTLHDVYKETFSGLVKYINKFTNQNDTTIIDFMASEICTGSIYDSLDKSAKLNLIKIFILKYIEYCSARMLIIVEDYCNLLNSTTNTTSSTTSFAGSTGSKVKKYKEGKLGLFLALLKDARNNIFGEYSNYNTPITTHENKYFEEFKHINEDLRHENLMLKNQIMDLKKKLEELEKNIRSSTHDDFYDDI